MISWNTVAIVAMVLVIATLLLLAWRVERWLTRRQDDAQAIRIQQLHQERRAKERELELREREVAVSERVPPVVQVPPVTEYPPEIMGGVIDESEEWARQDGLLLIAESYVESGGDWKKAGQHLAHRYASQPESRLPKELLH